jgi:hypothetical protein
LIYRANLKTDLFIFQMKKLAATPAMLVLQAMTNALQCHPGSGHPLSPSEEKAQLWPTFSLWVDVSSIFCGF